MADVSCTGKKNEEKNIVGICEIKAEAEECRQIVPFIVLYDDECFLHKNKQRKRKEKII